MVKRIIEIVGNVVAFFWVLAYVLFVHIKFVISEPRAALREIRRLLRRK